MGCWHHILAVVKNAVELAPQHGADPEVVEIAAWLHDIASGHRLCAVCGASYPRRGDGEGYPCKIRLRSGENSPCTAVYFESQGQQAHGKHSPEEICIADADAVSHFDAVPSLFYLAFVNRDLGIDEGTQFVVGKLSAAIISCPRRERESAGTSIGASWRLLPGAPRRAEYQSPIERRNGEKEHKDGLYL